MNQSQRMNEFLGEGGTVPPATAGVIGGLGKALKETPASKLLDRMITEFALHVQATGISKSDWKKVVTDLSSAVTKLKQAEDNRKQKVLR